MSKRAEMRTRRHRQVRFQTVFLGVLAVVVLGTIGYLVYSGIQSGGVVPVSGYDPGKADGPANAKVVIQEFSDFQ
jgi:hypothetical protein